jgi:hypothetical protein
MNFNYLPLLHTHLPDHAGTFCGIVGGTADQPFAAIILLDAKPATKLNWADACAWGTGLGEGCHVPTRDESAHLYATSRELLDQDNWNWTSTEYNPPYSESVAWMQDFSHGSQYDIGKSSERLCRAVRLIQLSA